jgi:hypothetical protein
MARRTQDELRRDVACAHCALPVPAGFVRPVGEPSYCCRGCATAVQ